ncbi:hypothetical protein ACLOJK_008263 [Asimina triloba]
MHGAGSGRMVAMRRQRVRAAGKGGGGRVGSDVGSWRGRGGGGGRGSVLRTERWTAWIH